MKIDDFFALATESMTQHLQSIGVKVHGVTRRRATVDENGKLVFEEIEDTPRGDEPKDGWIAMPANEFNLENVEIGQRFRLAGPLVFVERGGGNAEGDPE